MAVQFFDPSMGRIQRVVILTVPPKRIVRFLGSPDETIKLYLHMLESGSTPCLGEECDYCPMPVRLAAYAPVLEFFLGVGGAWGQRRAILPIYESVWDLASVDLRDREVIIGKRDGRKTGVMQFKVGKPLPPTRELSFDVLSRMMARWGIRSYTDPRQAKPSNAGL